MEMAVVKPKPQIRAGAANVRDGLNRFLLVHAAKRNETKRTIQLMRLASISRAQLGAVRRTARGIKFAQSSGRQETKLSAWRLKLDLSVGASEIEFPAGQSAMNAVAKLLGVPVRLEINEPKAVDWTALEPMEEFVHDLAVNSEPKSSAFSAFSTRGAPHLKVLRADATVLSRFPPLDLDTLAMYQSELDYELLKRHKIRRLDVSFWQPDRKFSSDQVFSETITSLGLTVDVRSLAPESVEAFCRHFSALEELHLIHRVSTSEDADEFVKNLWTKSFELRDRLNVPGLKRLFMDIKCSQHVYCFQISRIKKLKEEEPFDKATFWTNPISKSKRMLLKFNWRDCRQPTFFRMESEFYREEDYESDAESVGTYRGEWTDEELTDEGEYLEDSSEDEMDYGDDF